MKYYTVSFPQTVINQSRSFVEVWKDLEKWIEDKRTPSQTDTNNENEVIKSLCFVTDGCVGMKFQSSIFLIQLHVVNPRRCRKHHIRFIDF